MKFQVNPEDLFRQAFGGNFDFESIFGSDPGDQSKQSQNQTRTRVSECYFHLICKVNSCLLVSFGLCLITI